MEEHPNVIVARRAYEAFAGGDFAALVEMLADDVVWHVPGRSSIAGDYRGRDAVLAAFATLIELSDGTFSVEVHDIVGNDTHMVALQRNTGTRAGKTLDVTVAQVAHMTDGKVKEMWAHPFDIHAVDEFWS